MKRFAFYMSVLLLWCCVEKAIGDLVAYYPFNGNCNDASGNGHNGQPGAKGSAPLPTLCSDRIDCTDSAYCFVHDDRNNGNWITIPSLASRYFSRYTIAARFKVDRLNLPHIVISKGRSGPDVATNLGLGINTDGHIYGQHEINGWDSRQIVSTVPVEPGRWYHVALTYDGTDLKLYVEGCLDNVLNNPGDPADIGDWPVDIGANGEHDGFFDGRIDEVRIYDRALSAEEVTDLSLVAYFPFDGNMNDASGNGHHGQAGAKGGVSLPVLCPDRWGNPSSAYCFTHTDRYTGNWIKVPSLQCAYLKQYTVAALFKVNDFSLPHIVISKGRSGPDVATNLGLGIYTDGHIYGQHEINGSDSRQVISMSPVRANEWCHVALTYDGSELRLYVHGVLDAAHASPGDPADMGRWAVDIGANGEHDGFFAGSLDQVRIYDRALSPEEVQGLDGCVLQTYHVDGVDGNDGNDGLTRESAFATIQKGIDTALDHDTVVAWPGVYEEGCDFAGKAITVRSAADAAVVRNPSGYAFAFNNAEGPGSVLENMVLAGGKFGVYTGVGCSPTLKNLTIADNEFGVTCYENAAPVIVNCIIDNGIGNLESTCSAQYSWLGQEIRPMAYYAFDEPNGLTAYDSVGDKDGAISGASREGGIVGGALAFDGISDHVDIADTAALRLTNALTLTAWVKLDPAWDNIVAGAGRVICKRHDVVGSGYAMEVHRRRQLRGLMAYNDMVVSREGLLPVNEWTHVAVTYDWSTRQIIAYVDGAEVSRTTATSKVLATSYPLRVGMQADKNADAFAGLIDEAGVYDRALSAQEIAQMYASNLKSLRHFDPLFADRAGGDYHLKSSRGRYWAGQDVWVLDGVTSPCVDAGDPAENPSAEPGPNGGRVNMGAYGNTAYASRSEWPLAHDSNRDGRVNLGDLAAMGAEWLSALPWVE